jgi:MFS family permease
MRNAHALLLRVDAASRKCTRQRGYQLSGVSELHLLCRPVSAVSAGELGSERRVLHMGAAASSLRNQLREGFWKDLTPHEAAFVRKSRAVEVLFRAAIVVMFPWWQQSYLNLFDGDSGAMAVHYGVTRAVMAWIHLVSRPFFSCLSDTLGRKHLMTWGRLGTVCFFVFHRFRDRSPMHRLVMENVCWPPSNSCWPVFAAAHSDLFGSRPELSARIQAADGLWANVIGMFGGVLTSLISRLFSPSAGQEICAILTGATIVICASMPETLVPAKRRPFKLSQFLRRVNPAANVLLLFVKGPGLRRLATSTLLWFLCNEVWSTQVRSIARTLTVTPDLI